MTPEEQNRESAKKNIEELMAEMGRCLGCKWWKGRHEDGHIEHFAPCKRLNINHMAEDVQVPLAWVEEENESAELIATENFGCVEWESFHEPYKVENVDIEGKRPRVGQTKTYSA